MNFFNEQRKYPKSQLYSTYSISEQSMKNLFEKVRDFSATDLIWGSTEKYVSDISYCPLSLYRYDPLQEYDQRDMYLSNTEKITMQYISNVDRVITLYIGTFSYSSYKQNSYLDYEPYTRLEVFLPYYGLYDIPMKYANKYFISFWLRIDCKHKSAAYYITADNAKPIYNEVDGSIEGIAEFYSIDNNEVISSLNVSLFCDLPLSNNGLSDMKRNLIIGGINSAISIGSNLLINEFPRNTAISSIIRAPKEKNKVVKTRNKKTNRMKISRTEDTIEEGGDSYKLSESYSSIEQNLIGDISNGVNNAIQNIQMRPHSEKIGGNNSLNLTDTEKVIVYIIRQQVQTIRDDLSPKPCFNTGKLINAFGITELGINHFNSYNKFVTPITHDINAIKNMFNSQIICRPKPTGKSIILGDNFSKELLYNKSIFENLNDVDDVINNNGMINVNGYRIYHNHIPVRYDDFPSTRKYFIANLPLGQDTFNLSFDFCNNVIPNIAPNTYWEDIVNTNDITSVDGKIHINAKFNNVTNIDIPISYNNRILAVEEKDMIIPSESKTTYEAYEGYVKPLKVITNDGEKLFYFGEMSEWNVFILDPVYNREIGYGYLDVFSASNGYVFYKGNPLFYNGKAVRATDTIKDFNTPYTL